MRTGYHSIGHWHWSNSCDWVRRLGGNSTSNNGTIQFTASGEVLALGGYAFPPAMSGDPDFVDGWEVHFTKFLAVFDKVTPVGEPRHVADRSVADGQDRRRDRRPLGDRPAQGRSAHRARAARDEQAFPITSSTTRT